MKGAQGLVILPDTSNVAVPLFGALLHVYGDLGYFLQVLDCL